MCVCVVNLAETNDEFWSCPELWKSTCPVTMYGVDILRIQLQSAPSVLDNTKYHLCAKQTTCQCLLSV